MVGTQATYWQGKALAAGRTIHASLYARAAAGAENPGKGCYSDEVAVVTGASKGSIAASVVAQLLAGGATVIATTSKLDDSRLGFYRNLYRDNACFGAKLWVLPANMASYNDIDALVRWVGTEQTESLGPKSIHIKDSAVADLAVPFAAPRVGGDLSDAGARSGGDEVLLWAVQRLIAGLSHRCGPGHRGPTARGAAGIAQPGHVRRRRRCLRRGQGRAGRGGVALEGRDLVGAAGPAWRTR